MVIALDSISQTLKNDTICLPINELKIAINKIEVCEIVKQELESTNFYDEYMRASAEAAKEVLNEMPRSNPELFECDQSHISYDTYECNEIEEEELNIVDDAEPEECIKIIETTDKETSVKSAKNAIVNVLKEKGKRIKKKL